MQRKRFVRVDNKNFVANFCEEVFFIGLHKTTALQKSATLCLNIALRCFKYVQLRKTIEMTGEISPEILCILYLLHCKPPMIVSRTKWCSKINVSRPLL